MPTAAGSANVVCWRCGERALLGAQCPQGNEEQASAKAASSSIGRKESPTSEWDLAKDKKSSYFVWDADILERVSNAEFNAPIYDSIFF